MDLCSFEGNSEVYGLGIRIGNYIQWFTTIFAGLVAPDKSDDFVAINITFMLSILIALIYVTATKGDTLESGSLYAVEAYILLMLCIAGEMAREFASLSDSGTSRSSKRLPSIRRAIVLIGAFLPINMYALWFYSVGMYRMTRGACGDKIFLIVRLNLSGWFRIFALVFHSLIGFQIILGLVGLFGRWASRRVREAVEEKNSEMSDTLLTTKVTLGIFGVGSLVFIGAMIEVTIKYNHIQGVQSVNDTGQIIPLVLGCAGFVQLLTKLDYTKICKPLKDLLATVTGRAGQRPGPAAGQNLENENGGGMKKVEAEKNGEVEKGEVEKNKSQSNAVEIPELSNQNPAET